jgi:hypothetical protein
MAGSEVRIRTLRVKKIGVIKSITPIFKLKTKPKKVLKIN